MCRYVINRVFRSMIKVMWIVVGGRVGVLMCRLDFYLGGMDLFFWSSGVLLVVSFEFFVFCRIMLVEKRYFFF